MSASGRRGGAGRPGATSRRPGRCCDPGRRVSRRSASVARREGSAPWAAPACVPDTPPAVSRTPDDRPPYRGRYAGVLGWGRGGGWGAPWGLAINSLADSTNRLGDPTAYKQVGIRGSARSERGIRVGRRDRPSASGRHGPRAAVATARALQ